MLDSLYENIGIKIKNWAKWIFIVEAIGAIITGFVLLCLDEDFILYGLLAMILGPFVAWVGSWILYAFGELVEDVHTIRCKTVANSIEPTYTTQSQATSNSSPAQKQTTSPVVAAVPVATKGAPNKSNAPISAEIKDGEKVCPKCGTAQRIDRRVCWSCGQPFDN